MRKNQTLSRIAYLLSHFPSVSETFVSKEILELKNYGLNIFIFSLNVPPDRSLIHKQTHSLVNETCYIFKAKSKFNLVIAYLYSHLYFLIVNPLRYLKALYFAYVNGCEAFKSAPYCALYFRKHRINHIHAHFASTASEYALLLSIMLEIPYSFSAHAHDIYRPKLISEKIRRAAFVITCTDYNRNYLIENFAASSKEKIKLVYHGLDLQKFKPECRDNDNYTLLSVGRLIEKKGFSYLIDACKILKDTDIKFRLVIVGEGPEKSKLIEKTTKYGLNSSVEFIGFVEHESLISLYNSASVFVLPCVVTENGDRDGIPNVLMEAMAMGMPVVSTGISGIPEIIENGKEGILVSPNNSGELASAIRKLLTDKDLQITLGKNARERVLTDEIFDSRKNSEKIAKILLNC